MNKIIYTIVIFAFLVVPSMSYEYSRGGSSSGGFGGAGVITCEALNNIIKTERHEVSIMKDIPVIYKFSEPDINIYQIYVTGNEDENDVALRIEYLKGISVCVGKPAPGKIYKYINVWIGSQNIKDAIIKFKVENSLFKNNQNAGIDVYRWDKNNKEWIKLDITTVNRDDLYTNFEFNNKNFGPFAISEVEEQTPITISPIATAEVTTTDSIEKIVETPKKKSPGFEIITSIMLILSIIYLFRRKI